MKHAILARAVVLGLLTSDASAFVPPVVTSTASDANILHVANGCGPNRYRDPGGACHRWGYGPWTGLAVGWWMPMGLSPRALGLLPA